MGMTEAWYPTPQHAHAAAQIVKFFAHQAGVDAVLLVNSCARGKATPDSCLDIIVLVDASLRAPDNRSTVLERGENPATDALYHAWDEAPGTRAAAHDLAQAGRFAEVHLDITDGLITPGSLDRDEGLDGFELAVGNYFVYSRPLWQGTNRFAELCATWLPYYAHDLRAERLAATRVFCEHQLDHIEPYVDRGLYFQAFDRLYHAFQGFLQGLFIARRAYPIAYNKWIHEQVVDILGLPDLYRQLPGILEIRAFESRAMIENGERLRDLVAAHLSDL